MINLTHGSSCPVEAKDLAEARDYVARYPRDARGWPTSAAVTYASVALAKAALAAAGYVWAGDRLTTEGSIVELTVRRGVATAYVRPGGTPEVLATGPEGYLGSCDRPGA